MSPREPNHHEHDEQDVISDVFDELNAQVARLQAEAVSLTERYNKLEEAALQAWHDKRVAESSLSAQQAQIRALVEKWQEMLRRSNREAQGARTEGLDEHAAIFSGQEAAYGRCVSDLEALVVASALLISQEPDIESQIQSTGDAYRAALRQRPSANAPNDDTP